jgi:signal recognition particle GTPase
MTILDEQIKILFDGKPTGKTTTVAKLSQVYLQ